MEFDKATLELLRPAADLLRRTLQRLDDDDVSPALRRIADSSARRLPPPLLRRALVELDASEWLRDEVAAEATLEDASPEELFVRRPPGWEERLRALADEKGAEQQTRTVTALEKELSEALARISTLDNQLRSARDEVAEAERGAADRMSRQIAATDERRRQAERRARSESDRSASLERDVASLRGEVAELESRMEKLRQLLEKERRADPPPAMPAGPRGSFPSDPEGMAGELDGIVTATRRRPLAVQAAAGEAEPLRLPGELRPDRAEAIDWLLGRQAVWLIDGYNVAHHLAGHQTGAVDGTVRQRVVAAASRLATLTPPGTTVVVVFDSSVDQSSASQARRVKVIYEASADDWIIASSRPDTVVVSSDRRVREESESKGALGIWSEALTAWIQGRRYHQRQ